MTDLVLHFAPASCARVSLTALIETGAPFETKLVRFMAGEHKAAAYRRLNPKAKVPMLQVDGAPLTENVAILSFLNGLFPAAGLLPPVATPIDAACQIADLCFCSATLHPLVTRLRMPGMVAGPEQARPVWDKAAAAMRDHFQLVEDRLAAGEWWYGDHWSVMDAYLNWVFFRVTGAGFSAVDYPRFADHDRRSASRPAVQRALAIEAEADAELEAAGLAFKPRPVPA